MNGWAFQENAAVTENLGDLILALLKHGTLEAMICPSEVARAIVGAGGFKVKADDRRNAMPMVHAAVDWLVSEGKVQLSWKGKVLPSRTGPYGIRILPLVA